MAYQQVTLGTLKARLAERIESVPYWTPGEATAALNEGLRIWSAATGTWRTPVLVPTVPNDPYVAVPGTLVQATRLTWNGLPLERASLFDFDYAYPRWRNTTTASSGAPARPVYWAPISLSLFAIYPADAYASVNGTHAILVNGIRQTPILVNDADFVDLNQALFDVLLGYAQHVLAFKVGGQTLVASYPQWIAFLREAAEQNAQFAASSFYRKLLGLDQQRRLQPLEKGVPSAVGTAVGESFDMIVDPPTRTRVSQ